MSRERGAALLYTKEALKLSIFYNISEKGKKTQIIITLAHIF